MILMEPQPRALPGHSLRPHGTRAALRQGTQRPVLGIAGFVEWHDCIILHYIALALFHTVCLFLGAHSATLCQTKGLRHDVMMFIVIMFYWWVTKAACTEGHVHPSVSHYAQKLLRAEAYQASWLHGCTVVTCWVSLNGAVPQFP